MPCLRAARRSTEHHPGVNNTTLGCDVVARLIEYVFSRFSRLGVPYVCGGDHSLTISTRYTIGFVTISRGSMAEKHRRVQAFYGFPIRHLDRANRNYRTFDNKTARDKTRSTSHSDYTWLTSLRARGRKRLRYEQRSSVCSDLVCEQFNFCPRLRN